MHTEMDGFFAAGNLVQVYDLVDWVSMDGERAGRNAAAFATGALGERKRKLLIKRGRGIRCAVPQVYRAYGGEVPGVRTLYLRVDSVLKRPVFRFVGPNGVIGEVKKPYALPPEIVECDISGFVGEISGDGEITVEAVERAPLEDRVPLNGGPGGSARPGFLKTVPVTCILCPDSCLVRVFSEGGELRAEGARCAKGTKYAIKEVTDPRRTFTSSVMVLGGDEPVCPVRSTKPIRKDDWRKARKIVGETSVRAPVRRGATISRDFLERGIDLIASMSVGAAEEDIQSR
jgi:CxxC motif-containing protein